MGAGLNRVDPRGIKRYLTDAGHIVQRDTYLYAGPADTVR